MTYPISKYTSTYAAATSLFFAFPSFPKSLLTTTCARGIGVRGVYYELCRPRLRSHLQGLAVASVIHQLATGIFAEQGLDTDENWAEQGETTALAMRYRAAHVAQSIELDSIHLQGHRCSYTRYTLTLSSCIHTIELSHLAQQFTVMLTCLIRTQRHLLGRLVTNSCFQTPQVVAIEAQQISNAHPERTASARIH